jgi:hypothetical protein
VAFGALEDDAHHVRLTVRHDDTHVTQIEGEAVRLPWATCPGSVAGISSLEGTLLADSTRGLRGAYRGELHCTHMFDVAQLTIAHIAQGRADRQYSVWVSPPDLDGVTHGVVERDGTRVLEWDVAQGEIISPGPFEHVGLVRGFVERGVTLDEDTAEAGFLLRRATWMSNIHWMRLDDFETVAPSGLPEGACWTAQPGRMEVAFRNHGSQHDFSESPEAMLTDFDDYCASGQHGTEGLRVGKEHG